MKFILETQVSGTGTGTVSLVEQGLLRVYRIIKRGFNNLVKTSIIHLNVATSRWLCQEAPDPGRGRSRIPAGPPVPPTPVRGDTRRGVAAFLTPIALRFTLTSKRKISMVFRLNKENLLVVKFLLKTVGVDNAFLDQNSTDKY